MIGKILKISINRINFQDDTFHISFNQNYSLLRDSIKKIGLVNPPILYEEGSDNYIIVSGLGRLSALKEIGIDNVESQIIPNCDIGKNFESELFQLNFFGNLLGRGFNIIEQSIALNKLMKYFSQDEIINQFLPLLNHNPSKAIFEKIIEYQNLPHSAKIMLIEGDLNTNIISGLIKLSKDEVEDFIKIFSRTKMTISVQKEFFDGIEEISKRKDIRVQEILKSNEISVILKDEKLLPIEKCERIRIYIKRNVYPQFSKTEEDFNRVIKESNLPGDIKITHSPFFEGKSFKFEISAENSNELQKRVKQLQDNINKIKSIFEM